MNKTVTANISGIFFHIDEDAYQTLSAYLENLRNHFRGQEGSEEILQDIESRIAEMLKNQLGKSREVVNLEDVQEVMITIGTPEQMFGETEGAPSGENAPGTGMAAKRLYRDPDSRLLGGVCGGIGAYFNMDPVWIRLAFLLMFFLMGFGPLIYIILWIIVPLASTPIEKLAMRGEAVNLENIKRSINKEYESVKKKVNDLGRETADSLKTGRRKEIERGFNEILEFFVQLFRLLLKIIVKIGAAFFILLALGIAIALTAAWLSGDFGHISSNGSTFTLNSPELLKELIFPTTTAYHVFMAGLMLTLGIPLLALLLAGIRMLFHLRKGFRPVNISLGLLWLTGVTMITITVLATARHSAKPGISEEKIPLYPAGDTLFIKIDPRTPAGTIVLLEDDEEIMFLAKNKNSVLSGIYMLDIKASEDSVFYLESKKKARGKTRSAARSIARNSYGEHRLQGSELVLHPWLISPSQDKFHFQHVRVTIRVPEGKTIFLGEHTAHYLDDVANSENTGDYWMENHFWKMESRMLKRGH